MINPADYYSDLLGEAPVSETALPPASPSPAMAAVAGEGASVAFDGADEVKKLVDWNAALRSADADLLPVKGKLDARARDTLRNDGYVAGGERIHRDSIVGAQFLLNAKPASAILFGKEDSIWENEFQEEVESKFTLWAESPQRWVDASRNNTLTGLVRLAVGVHLAGGEALMSAEWLTRGFRPFNTAIQMIDADRLSTPWDRKWDTDIRMGVERDYYGAPTAYHIRVHHENEFFIPNFGLDRFKWRRIAARKPWGRQQILHIFEQTRPGQTRGISTMATALAEMRMAKRFRQTELERAIIAATYAASIETELPAGEVYAAMGGGDEGSNPTVDWSAAYLAAVNAYSGGAKNLQINGARIPVFWPGTHLKIQNPGAASPAGSGFEQSLLRHIAAALDLSYEQLSRDYTQTNYSSARAAMGETGRSMQARKKMVADQTATFVYRLWLEEAINRNLLECLKRREVPQFYEALNAEAYSAAEWIGAGQGTIDPKKETEADILALNAGLDTKEAIIARRHGRDWRSVARQRARENALDEDLGLQPTGAIQIAEDQEGADDKEDGGSNNDGE